MTDYRLSVSILNIKIYPARQPQGQKAPKRLDVSKLKEDNKRKLSSLTFATIWAHCNSVKRIQRMSLFRNAFHSSVVDNLGHKSRKNQDWFDENDEEIQDLLEEKYRLHKTHLDVTSSVSNTTAYNSSITRADLGTCKSPD